MNEKKISNIKLKKKALLLKHILIRKEMRSYVRRPLKNEDFYNIT